MITSYVTPQRTMLYLSLVGSLDSGSSDDLVHEYHERLSPTIRRCILDLGAVEEMDENGLSVMQRLQRIARADQVEFSVVAGRSHRATAVGAAAGRYSVPVVDGRNLPLQEPARGQYRGPATPAAS
ncbi:MAG: STAS domain-containing protein [Planctomycetota bacterium]|jgi:anti-anti-sigma regulatory factor